jgi:UDP-N-acetylglucosamine 2-epimerase
VPLLILRQETEWSYLVSGGKALLVGNRPETILAYAALALDEAALAGMRNRACVTASGAAQRIVERIDAWLAAREERHARTSFKAQPSLALGA